MYIAEVGRRYVKLLQHRFLLRFTIFGIFVPTYLIQKKKNQDIHEIFMFLQCLDCKNEVVLRS